MLVYVSLRGESLMRNREAIMLCRDTGLLIVHSNRLLCSRTNENTSRPSPATPTTGSDATFQVMEGGGTLWRGGRQVRLRKVLRTTSKVCVGRGPEKPGFHTAGEQIIMKVNLKLFRNSVREHSLYASKSLHTHTPTQNTLALSKLQHRTK